MALKSVGLSLTAGKSISMRFLSRIKPFSFPF
jgi:hypothetical protein